MSPNEARDSILSIFHAIWQPPRIAIYTDTDTAASDKTWARAILRHANGQRSAWSDNGRGKWTFSGTLWVQVFVPFGNPTGYDEAMLVLNAYRDVRGGPVRYSKHTFREVGRSGAFEQNNVLVNFEYDDVR